MGYDLGVYGIGSVVGTATAVLSGLVAGAGITAGIIQRGSVKSDTLTMVLT